MAKPTAGDGGAGTGAEESGNAGSAPAESPAGLPTAPFVPAVDAGAGTTPPDEAATGPADVSPLADDALTGAQGGDAGRGAGGSTAVTGALEPAEDEPPVRRGLKVRSWLALLLVIMALVTVSVSVVALWSRSLVFDTDTYVRLVAPIADDPEVRRSVSVFVTDKAVEVADLERRIEDALPADAKVLAAPLTAELRSFLVGEIDEFLGSDLAREIWVDVNRLGHRQLLTALRDENPYVTVGRNDVRLNLLPLVAVALQKLEDRIPQLLGKDVRLPAIDPGTAPDQIRVLLQDALGRELPADFASVTLLRGDQGYEAKQALRLFNDLVILVVAIAVALVAAALLVSVRRRRTALQLGIGALVAFVVARVIERQIEGAVAGAVGGKGGAAVARSIVRSAIDTLNGFFVWVAVAGVVVAVATLLAARPSWVRAMGRGFAKLFGVASDLSSPETGAGLWLASHLDALRLGGVAAAVLALFFVAGSLAAILAVVLALVIYELVLTAFAAGLPAPGDDEPPPAR